MRRRWLWAVGLVVLAAAGGLGVRWGTTRHARVSLQAFRLIESGMTQADVEAALGGVAHIDPRKEPLPDAPSYGRYSLVERNEPVSGYTALYGFSEAPRHAPIYALAWANLGLRKIIIVTFLETGRVAHAEYLELSYQAQPPLAHRVYAWLGL